MSQERFQAARKALKLKKKAVAEVMGTTENAVVAWSRPETSAAARPVPPDVLMGLELAAKFGPMSVPATAGLVERLVEQGKPVVERARAQGLAEYEIEAAIHEPQSLIEALAGRFAIVHDLQIVEITGQLRTAADRFAGYPAHMKARIIAAARPAPGKLALEWTASDGIQQRRWAALVDYNAGYYSVSLGFADDQGDHAVPVRYALERSEPIGSDLNTLLCMMEPSAILPGGDPDCEEREYADQVLRSADIGAAIYAIGAFILARTGA